MEVATVDDERGVAAPTGDLVAVRAVDVGALVAGVRAVAVSAPKRSQLIKRCFKHGEIDRLNLDAVHSFVSI